MMYSDDDMLMLSGIQHFRFCPRQWALIHIEQQWDDNRLTMEGSLMHQHADDPFYLSVFPHLILQQKTDFPFAGRNRQPPKDAVNAMLSLAYTLLANDMTAALETVGLDPYVGFFHTLRQ